MLHYFTGGGVVRKHEVSEATIYVQCRRHGWIEKTHAKCLQDLELGRSRLNESLCKRDLEPGMMNG